MDNLMQQVADFSVQYGLKIIGAILILIAGRIVAGMAGRGVRKAAAKGNLDPALTGFFSKLASVAILAFAVIAALAKFGVQTTSFVAVLGAAGFAVGFALQGSLSNFAAGVMILFFRPFKVGDFVSAGGEMGSVKEIGLFTTTLATPDNVQVIVPNGTTFGGVIKNFAGYPTRRVEIEIGISYGASIDKAREIMRDLIVADERVLKDPPYQIAVAQLADSSVNFVVRMWVNGADFWGVKFDMTERIKKTFDAQGIEIPFPQRVVHMMSS